MRIFVTRRVCKNAIVYTHMYIYYTYRRTIRTKFIA